jgi:flagellar biosynthesis/type III secretory pathway M-ring protein FliF/YscJ
MNRILKWAIGTVLVLIAAAILIRAFAQVIREQREEDEEKSEKEIKKLPSVSVQNGQTVLTIDPHNQARLGLTVVSLQASSSREQVTAPAVVLPVQDLIDLRPMLPHRRSSKRWRLVPLFRARSMNG